MKLLVNAGFGEPISGDWKARIQKVAMGVRQDVPHGADHVYIRELVENVVSEAFEGIFVVGGWMELVNGTIRSDKGLRPNAEHVRDQAKQTVHEWKQLGAAEKRLWIEIGNELDLSYWKKHLDEYHHMATLCYRAIREVSPDVRVITGSTSNFNKKPAFWKSDRGYELLKKLCRMHWPSDTLQGLHPYRTRNRQSEWPSFDSQDEALRALKDVLRGRKVAITEAGWHEGDLSPEEIADFTREEIKMWRDFGAEIFVLYQIQDGHGDTSEDRFGVYRPNGDSKPVTQALVEWKSQLSA